MGEWRIFSKPYIYFVLYMCECLCIYMCTTCMQVPEEVRRQCRPLETGVRGDCELAAVGTGNS